MKCCGLLTSTTSTTEARTTTERFVSQQSDVLSGSLTTMLAKVDVIRDIVHSTGIFRPMPELKIGLAEELKKHEALGRTWELAERYFRKYRHVTGHEALNQPQFPDEYHLALITYVLDTYKFYEEFNRVTRMATKDSVATYPYKYYFKFLLSAVTDMLGQPVRPDRDVLYRGMTGKLKLNVDEYVFFQQFVSTSRDRELALRFVGEQGTLFVLEQMMTTSVRELGDLYPAFPNASCLDHVDIYGEVECLIWPLEFFKVTRVENKGGVRYVYLRA